MTGAVADGAWFCSARRATLSFVILAMVPGFRPVGCLPALEHAEDVIVSMLQQQVLEHEPSVGSVSAAAADDGPSAAAPAVVAGVDALAKLLSGAGPRHPGSDTRQVQGTQAGVDALANLLSGAAQEAAAMQGSNSSDETVAVVANGSTPSLAGPDRRPTTNESSPSPKDAAILSSTVADWMHRIASELVQTATQMTSQSGSEGVYILLAIMSVPCLAVAYLAWHIYRKPAVSYAAWFLEDESEGFKEKKGSLYEDYRPPNSTDMPKMIL